MAINDQLGRVAQLAIVLALAVIIVNALFGTGLGGGGGQPFNQTSDAEVVDGSGTLETPAGSSIDTRANTRATLGDAVSLTGANDSQVDIQASVTLDANHEVCTVVALDPNENGDINRTQVIQQAEDLVLHYDEGADEYQAWYFDDATRGSAEVSVPAPAPTAANLVCGQLSAGGSTLTIFRNTTQGSTHTFDGSTTTPIPADQNMDGILEETRIYNRTLNSSQRAEFNSSRTVAVTGQEPAVRVMYDSTQTSPSSVDAYFASGDATLQNASLVAGLSGPSLTRGTDYTFSGDQVLIPSGSSLDDSGNVLFVDVNGSGGATAAVVATVQDGLESAFTFAPILLIVILAAAIMSQVRGTDE